VCSTALCELCVAVMIFSESGDVPVPNSGPIPKWVVSSAFCSKAAGFDPASHCHAASREWRSGISPKSFPISHKSSKITSVRTTVDIPDALYRELKSKAAREKRSVKELILRSVEVALRVRRKKSTRRITLPIISSKNPGTLKIDNAQIYDLIPFP
jgi:predicted DNA-binding ribbon-helix-helix protein